MAKYKVGDKVSCNGSDDCYVKGYKTDKLVYVGLWCRLYKREVGCVVQHEDELVSNLEEIKEIAEDFAN